MYEILEKLLNEIWFLLKEMSLYLIFGALIAGVLKVLMPADFFRKI